uniref:FidU2 n=2 Tax=Fischerella muscicola UTEX 1829 TaxID=83542 RepID=A0A1L1VVY1_FISMU|nr:FidU2 [Fischerella muscicola UTEX 1829]
MIETDVSKLVEEQKLMKQNLIVAVTVFLIYICFTINTPANAANVIQIPINNPGFEDPFLKVKDEFTLETPTNWTMYNPDGLIPQKPTDSTSYLGVTNAFPRSAFYNQHAPEGRNIGSVYLIQKSGSGIAGLEQTLDATLEPNTKYTLMVDIGNAADSFKDISLAVFPGYCVELLAGDTVLAADENTISIEEGGFKTSTVTFTTKPNTPLLGQKLGIRLINLLQSSSANIDFDNVRLTAQPTNI